MTSSRQRYLLFIAATALLVIGTLAWLARGRLVDYEDYHRALAQEASNGATASMAGFILEKQRLVQVFADQHAALLADLARQPDDQSRYQDVAQLVSRYFPNHFAFTLARPDGSTIIDDFEGMVGNLCSTDITSFSKGQVPQVRIHPNDKAYHFDTMASYQAGDAKGILFISFHADILAQVLKAAQPVDHQLLLIYPSNQDLIEVSVDGARIKWDRNDYRLSTEEQGRILQRAEVPGTAWEIVDLRSPGLFADFERKLWLESVAIFVVFMAIAMLMLVFVNRAERLRALAEQHKDDFLAVVSHEIRTPLTSIRGALGLIGGGIGGSLSDKGQELVEVAQRNCDRLIVLINDILDVRKMEAGEMTFDLKPQELLPLVERSIESNRGYAEKLGASMRLTEALPGLMVNVDPVRIEQALTNLLSNAVKYGKDGDCIEVCMQRHDSFVRVSVIDHGEGVPLAFQGRIFQKFSQADSSSTRSVAGTGLGLCIVRMILESHGGRAGFESGAGRGSTFYIELPVQA